MVIDVDFDVYNFGNNTVVMVYIRGGYPQNEFFD